MARLHAGGLLMVGLGALMAIAAGCDRGALQPLGKPDAGGRDAGIEREIVSRGTRALGDACSAASDCASFFCADGVCCNSECGVCRTCAGPGAVGLCVNVPEGAADPRGTCTDEGPESCGHNGTCNGAGECKRYPPGTTCKRGGCADDAVIGQYVCTDTGACKLGPTIICAPFRCDPTTNDCFPECTTAAECLGGRPCTSGSCLKQKISACESDGECASGHCVDHVCCNTACDGPCSTCKDADHVGTCLPKPEGTACSSPTCTGNLFVGAGACDAVGMCVVPGPLDCSPFTCDTQNARCQSTCASMTDCAPGFVCSTGRCALIPNPW